MKQFGVWVALFATTLAYGQFTVQLSATSNFEPKDVYIYTLNGSKDVLVSKVTKQQNQWVLKYPSRYVGMMKAYFPENNFTLNFISENKDVRIKLEPGAGTLPQVVYEDAANQVMNQMQNYQRKVDNILPALHQMKGYYSANEPFFKAITQEISTLSKGKPSAEGFDFVTYYSDNYGRLVNTSSDTQPTAAEIVDFFVSSNELLESSNLMRPLLVTYLNRFDANGAQGAIDSLLAALDIESSRGQTVLSEVIDIFGAYNMPEMKKIFLAKGSNLKCTLNDRLASTLEVNLNTEVGSVFANYQFNNATNSESKSIHEVKAKRKVIAFWSSTCQHCETDLPKFIPYYKKFQEQGFEIIGLSMDTDAQAYESRAKAYPWVNDTELRGWYSSFAEKYNVSATPTYFVLDENNKIIGKPDYASDVIKFLGLN